MSKDFNATQKKLLQSIKNSEQLHENTNSKSTFDFPCINDYCTGKNGTRIMGIAWKEKETYDTFCYQCGQEYKLTKEEFSVNKEKFRKESIEYNMEKEKVKAKQFQDNYKLKYESLNEPKDPETE